MQYFAALAAIVPLVAAHGFVQDPPARKPGTAFKAACGEQPYNQQSSDINGNVQGIMQVVGTDFDAAECNLWLCKGFQLDDNTDNVQSFALGETIPFKVTIAAPHTGYANVSVVKTSTNSVIGEPLIEFTNYASNAGVAANNSAFSVTIPDDLGSDCTTAGDCVLQWFWDAPDIDQTYESCVDFTIGAGSSGSEPAVSSTPAAASSAAAASTVAAVSSKAVSEAASSAVTTALAAVTETPAVTTAEAPAATTSAAADDEECPADDDEADDGEDDSADDGEECPADDETDDGEDDSADDGEECPADDETDDGEDTEASITQAAVSVTQAASVTAVAQVSTTPAAQSGSGSSGANNSGSGNSGHYSAVTSYVTVSAKPQTKHHTKYVTVTAAAPACTN
ncbi:hypothetical protein AK830_g8380 [Neonectria ditissima]|uniref:Chitin-binding type-4 domain-containing protein n=1 Tax=Neonectria ditissima TaxID=78410 RepID=A0A0P7AKK7_9HYPO|nr:hypothetical protein AK830_g8380 [Neonectria ditissima]